MLKENLRKGEVSERRKGPLLCTTYKDNPKPPVLISTKATAGMQQTTNSRGKDIVRPRSSVLYNSAMGGVVTNDARLYAYLSERRSLKWTTKLFFALYGRAVLNAYLLYNEHFVGTPKLTRLQFTMCALEQMMVVGKRRSKTQLAAAAEEVPQDRVIPPPQHGYLPAPPRLVKKSRLFRYVFSVLRVGKNEESWYENTALISLTYNDLAPGRNRPD
ncbi:hypothetical protein RRG08_049459 [Elysia crispata]|uniref:PiggyBac transposable element-derived protein domain-containing protein n=1 Tax=Elysia crispata TaxID=231223 RepID=A0AAE1DM66_9GAST|nr:hypothetical protein RRG08_049459 [Elysia crispata]